MDNTLNMVPLSVAAGDIGLGVAILSLFKTLISLINKHDLVHFTEAF